MKYFLKKILLVGIFCIHYFIVNAQCAMCTKTAQQLGEKPAKSLNTGILYLMLAPFAIVGFIAFKWWRSRRHDSN